MPVSEGHRLVGPLLVLNLVNGCGREHHYVRNLKQNDYYYFYNYRRQKCCGIHPVYLEETVEFNRFFQIDRDKTASAPRN